jgi:hypothetical protein
VRRLTLILIVILMLPLLAHGYVGQFVRFMADDYCGASLAVREGLFSAVTTTYATWKGRYTDTFLQSAAGLIGSPSAAILPPLAILLWVAAFWWTIRQLSKAIHIQLPVYGAPLLACTLVFAILDSSPQLTQSLYWMAAVIPYTLPLILLTVYIGFLASRLHHPVTVIAMLMSAVLAFVTGGFSELVVAFQIAALGAAAAIVFLWVKGSARRSLLPLLGVGLAASVLALVIILAAPGNAARRALFPPPPDLLALAQSTLIYTLSYLAASLLSLATGGMLLTFGLAMAVALMLPQRVRPVEARYRRLLRRSAMLATLVCVGLVAACIASGVYATSGLPPARTYIVPQFALLVTSAYIGFAIGVLWQGRMRRMRIVGVGLVALLVIMTARSTLSTLRIAPFYATYASEWDRSEALIREAKAEGVMQVALPAFTVNIPASIGLEYLEPNPDFYINRCAAEYYGVQTISVGETG